MDQIQNQNSAAMHVQAAVTRLLQLGNVEQATALWNQYLRQTAHLQLQPPQFGLLVPPFMAGPQQVGPGPVPVRQQQANQAPPIPARPKAAVAAKNEKAEVILDDEDEPPEEEGQTYSHYKAAVGDLYGHLPPHPDPLVETLTLASIELPKPTFQHSLGNIANAGLISDAQMDVIVYASQKFHGPRLAGGQRAGFFLGDGAGVGKGRQIAALIKQHWAESGRHVLWVSVSTDLRRDAERDLSDIDASDIQVHPQGNGIVPQGNLKYTGVLFVTYSLLVNGLKRLGASTATKEEDSEAPRPGISSRQRKRNMLEEQLEVPVGSRLHQVINWLKTCPKGSFMIFDESHKAKNLLPDARNVPSQTARAIVELQRQLPDAKVLYSSATGASEPRNLAYMTRLANGFKDPADMIELLKEAKLGALELAAMSLKSTGSYLARTLSYQGAEFGCVKVELDPVYKIMYERTTYLWTLLLRIMVALPEFKKRQGMFWASHQRFYRSMLMAGKVRACAQLAQQAVRDGLAVVIGLQSTGEAGTQAKKNQGEELTDMISAPQMTLEQFIKNNFPLTCSELNDTVLDALEFQVFEALQQWQHMLPAAQMVGANDEASRLLGANINADAAASISPQELDGMKTKLQTVLKEEENRKQDVRAIQAAAQRAAQRTQLLEQQKAATTELEQSNAKLEGLKQQLGGTPDDADLPLVKNEQPYATGAGPSGSGRQQQQQQGEKKKVWTVDLMDSDSEDDDQPRTKPTKPSSAPDGKKEGLVEDSNPNQNGPTPENQLEVDLTGDSEDDNGEVMEVPAAPSLDSTLKMEYALELQRLQRAQRRLNRSQADLEALQQEEQRSNASEGGLPPTRTSKKNRRSQAGRAAAAAAMSHDPGVRNMTLESFPMEGYRHAVRTSTLSDIPDEFPGQSLGVEDASLATSSKDDVKPQLQRMRRWLLMVVSALELPINPLDDLLNLLGGNSKVAEMTGRRTYVGIDESGNAAYIQRKGDGAQKDINLREKEAFMSGKKLYAIISDAASTGISLQADRRVGNQRRRCHITLELPWSADKAIQQFGRSHRANQTSAPLYRILVTPCGGEYRFASAAAKRLASLGALLRGDRNAIGAGMELKEFDIDNLPGDRAVLRVLSDIAQESKPMVGVLPPTLPPECSLAELVESQRGNAYNYNDPMPSFFPYMLSKVLGVGLLELEDRTKRVKLPKKMEVSRFLNRLLGLPIGDQDLLFQYFSDTLDATKVHLKSTGHWDDGIVNMRAASCKLVSKRLVHTDPDSGGCVHHVELAHDSGLTWAEAISYKQEVCSKLQELYPEKPMVSGFYVHKELGVSTGGSRFKSILLATEAIQANTMNTILRIQRPFAPTKNLTLIKLTNDGYRRIDDQDAEQLWKFWYDWSEHSCFHGQDCMERRRGGVCRQGMRLSEVHLLSGAVLPVWHRLDMLHRSSQWARKRQTRDGTIKTVPLRVVRCVTQEGEPVVGVEAVCRDQVKFFLKNGLIARSRPDEEDEFEEERSSGAIFLPGSKKPKRFR